MPKHEKSDPVRQNHERITIYKQKQLQHLKQKYLQKIQTEKDKIIAQEKIKLTNLNLINNNIRHLKT